MSKAETKLSQIDSRFIELDQSDKYLTLDIQNLESKMNEIQNQVSQV